IWRLARRFPIESGRLPRSLLLHVPAAAFFSVLQPFLQVIIVWIMRLFSDPLMTIMKRRSSHLFWDFSFGVIMYWLILAARHAIRYQARLRAEELRASQLEGQLAQAQLSALK